MLILPRSTQVNRRVAKDRLYANASLPASAKISLKEQVEAVIWRHKLAETTLGVAAGESVREIQVFEILLRQKSLDRRILPALAKAIPYKILFLLSFENEVQAWMEVAGAFYGTGWLAAESLSLQFEGLTLDTVYENLARQIAGGRLGAGGDIVEAVERDKHRQRLGREIAALQQKVLRQKQFNRQVELNGELKRLRAELEKLG